MSRFFSTATITRPADTNAYAAGDVVNGTSSEAIEFTNIGRPGAVMLITAAHYRVDVASIPSGKGAMTLHLYSAKPANIADNAAYNLVAADRSKYVGSIEIPSVSDLGDTIFSQNDELRKQVVMLGSSLWGFLVTKAAFTPTSAAVKTVNLFAIETEKE